MEAQEDIGHEAISLVLLVDSLWDDYTKSWDDKLAVAFDAFQAHVAHATSSDGISRQSFG